MSLKEKINDMRNSVVASMSEVADKNGADTRTIKNGRDRYVVEKSRVFNEKQMRRPDDFAIVDTVSFKARDNSGNTETLSIEKIRPEGPYDRIEEDFKVSLGSSGGISLLYATDINDINSIRYQLGKDHGWYNNKAKQLAHFIDKFVIVTPEERKAYKEYAAKLDRQERDALEAKKTKERAERKEQKARDKQYRKDAAAKAAAAKKIKEKFAGK